MSKPKPPQFLSDLYADLRDRHLLLPALVLLVAVVVVPVALSQPAETTTPPAPAGGDESSAIVPAVLADQPAGVRAYAKRLADRKSTNPFKQHFTSVPKGDQLQGASVPKGDQLQGASAVGTPAASDTSGAATGTVATSEPTSTTSQPSTRAPVDQPSTTPGGHRDGRHHVETHLFVHRVDVAFGTGGDMKRFNGVKILTGLPSGEPIVTFLGTNDQGKKALFAVSPDVDSVDTEGRCTPSPTTCTYLVMAAGETTKLHYVPDDTTYRLRLLHVRTVELNGHHHDFQLKQQETG
jgi:hypothetical protein